MPTCTIIDGQALVQAIGKLKGAKPFTDLADVFVQTVFRHAKNDCTRVDVVFDRYDCVSIKLEQCTNEPDQLDDLYVES